MVSVFERPPKTKVGRLIMLTTVLIIYISIGFGVWLGLAAIRLKAKGFKYLTYEDLSSLLRGFFGALFAWPILIFYIEP